MCCWTSWIVSRRLFVSACPRRLSTLKLFVLAGKIRKATTVISGLCSCVHENPNGRWDCAGGGNGPTLPLGSDWDEQELQWRYPLPYFRIRTFLQWKSRGSCRGQSQSARKSDPSRIHWFCFWRLHADSGIHGELKIFWRWVHLEWSRLGFAWWDALPPGPWFPTQSWRYGPFGRQLVPCNICGISDASQPPRQCWTSE